jgi:hypothetical protein
MTVEGPALESFTHRLSECPAEFLLPPGTIDIGAILADHFRAMQNDPAMLNISATISAATTRGGTNLLSLMAVTTWILHDHFFLSDYSRAPAMWLLLQSGLDRLSQVVTAEHAVRDPDRREELVRVILAALNLRPAGETEPQAADRLTTLDSVVRTKVITQTRDAEARARQIRQKMAEDAAKAAAARYSPE